MPQITREELNNKQGLFDNLRFINPNEIATNDVQYGQLREIVKYIRDGASSVEGINGGKFIFLVGPTGSGKSTLSNYLDLGDDGFVAASNYGTGGIKLKNPQESIADIGSGEGSTTVIPNMYTIEGIDGIFLDCAGDGDTSGIIGDIINAMVRDKISQNAQQAKIALIAKQASLDSNGGYGALLKSSLDQNAQFFKNIESFKDSLGFVITGAVRHPEVIESIRKNLHNIANHNNFVQYKDLMKHILAKSEGNSLIVPFAQAPVAAKENQPYSAEPSQHDDIKDMIQNLPYSPQLPAGYFNIPKSPESIKAMSHILEAVVARGAYIIRNAIDEAPHPFNICSVEVNPFYEYISGLANGYQAEYAKYCKVLKYNNYLKINNLDIQAVETIDADIKFVSNFVNNNNNVVVSKDWSLIANISNIFNSIKQDIVEFKTENANGNLFNSSADKASIKISFAGNKSGEIKNAIDKVKDNYKDFGRLEVLKNDQNSEYFKDVKYKVFSHQVPKEKTIEFTENEPYVVRPAYTTQEEHGGHWGLVPRFMGIKVGEKEWIPHWVNINHYPATYGTRLVTKTKTVTEMVPVYRTITNREFIAEKYQNELAELQYKLGANVEEAIAIMEGIPANQGDAIKENIQHDTCPQVRDLLIGWQNAELSQYFNNNPANSLEVLDIEVIGMNL